MSSTTNNGRARGPFRTCSVNSDWYGETLETIFIRTIDLLRFPISDPPVGQPTLLVPDVPLRQGQPTNFTCLSSPSKPASQLILYRNEQTISDATTTLVSYEIDPTTKKNLTKLVFQLDDPDGSWDGVFLRCEQIYQFVDNYRKDVSQKIQTLCKSSKVTVRIPTRRFRQAESADRIAESLPVDGQLHGDVPLHRSGQSVAPISVMNSALARRFIFTPFVIKMVR